MPDAWDDDWVKVADKAQAAPKAETTAQEVKLSRAERKAKHAEANKQLWDAAETPAEKPMFLLAKGDAPLSSDFKPAMKLLSRKPTPQIAKKTDATAGIGGLRIDDEDDSEEEARKKNAASLAERQAKAQKEREEKQRKYNEVRERLFGSSQQEEASTRESQSPARSSRGKGRGGRDRNDSQPTSSADQSPARGSGRGGRALYDPTYSAKPNSVFLQRKDASESGAQATPKTTLQQPIRAPRGPDGSGRGGFGFAPRGDRTGSAT